MKAKHVAVGGIALLAVVAALIAVRWNSLEAHRTTDETRVVMKQIHVALTNFKTKCGRFPSSEEGLVSVLKPGSSTCRQYVPERDQSSDLRDAWGNPFLYEAHGDSYRLISAG